MVEFLLLPSCATPLSDRVHLDFVCVIFFIFIYFCYWRASTVNGTLLIIGGICLFICMFGRTYAIFVFVLHFCVRMMTPISH